MNKVMILGTTALFMAGCVSTVEDQIVERSEDFLDSLSVIDFFEPTNDLNMQTVSGSASYSGEGVIVVTAPVAGGELVLLGEANLNANFDDNRINGRIDDFVGGDTYGDQYGAMSGSINLSNGAIGGVNAGDLSADFSGSLNGMGMNLVTEGSVAGEFYGASTQALLMTTDGYSSTTTIDGWTEYLDLVIVARD